MIEIIPFEFEHAKFIATHQMNAEIVNVKDRYLKNLESLVQPKTSWTGLVDNKIIAAGGMVELWDHVYEGWIMATADIKNHPIATARIIKRIFKKQMPLHKVQRLQTTVKADYEIGHKFANWLGLTQEGLMKQYLDGNDYYLYARTY